MCVCDISEYIEHVNIYKQFTVAFSDSLHDRIFFFALLLIRLRNQLKTLQTNHTYKQIAATNQTETVAEQQNRTESKSETYKIPTQRIEAATKVNSTTGF